MSDPDGNPFEPPSPAADLPVDRVAGRSGRVTEVTFRYSNDDLRRAGAFGGLPQPALFVMIIVLTCVGVGLGVWPTIRLDGWSPDVIRPIAISSLPVVAVVLTFSVLAFRRSGRGPSEAPFETTVSLTPSAFIVREQGIAELRRSWSSVAAVTHDRHQIRFQYQLYEPSTGRFVPQPGQIVPIRAFATEQDAASFLAAAREHIAAAGPILPAS